MKTQLQLIASTIALTVLIWVYADQSVHDTYQTTVVVKYALTAGTGDSYVLRVVGARSEAPDIARAEVTFRGPKSAIRGLEKDDSAGRLKLAVILSDEPHPGLQPPRDLFADLSRLPEIRDRGLTLQRVWPQTIQLHIDRYRSIEVPVEVSAGVFEKSLLSRPIVAPEKVKVRVLQSALERFGPLPPLRLGIEEELQARSEQAGGMFSFDAPLRSSAGWPGIEATFTPDHVRVTVQMARRTARERITLIPLRLQIEAQNFGDYQVQWQDQTGGQFMQAIDVRVPVEKAGQLKGNMVDAYLPILDSDLPKELPGVTTTRPASESWIEREVHFVFPPGFEDTKIEGPPRTVKFRVTPRADLAPSTPAVPVP
jgi:hypothetical protein